MKKLFIVLNCLSIYLSLFIQYKIFNKVNIMFNKNLNVLFYFIKLKRNIKIVDKRGLKGKVQKCLKLIITNYNLC